MGAVIKAVLATLLVVLLFGGLITIAWYFPLESLVTLISVLIGYSIAWIFDTFYTIFRS
jgi:hypothetical protein